jgi:hypothetical protein
VIVKIIALITKDMTIHVLFIYSFISNHFFKKIIFFYQDMTRKLTNTNKNINVKNNMGKTVKFIDINISVGEY